MTAPRRAVEAAIDAAQKSANCTFEETVAGEFCNTHHCYSDSRHETRSECDFIANLSECAVTAARPHILTFIRDAIHADGETGGAVREALGLRWQRVGLNAGFLQGPAEWQRRVVGEWPEAQP